MRDTKIYNSPDSQGTLSLNGKSEVCTADYKILQNVIAAKGAQRTQKLGDVGRLWKIRQWGPSWVMRGIAKRQGENASAEGAVWPEVLRLALKESQGDLGAGGEVLGMEGQGHQENSVTGEPWEIWDIFTWV